MNERKSGQTCIIVDFPRRLKEGGLTCFVGTRKVGGRANQELAIEAKRFGRRDQERRKR
jgi:hypothetical protein